MRGEKLCLKPQSFSSLLKILFTGICPVDFRTAEFEYLWKLLVLNPEKCRKAQVVKSNVDRPSINLLTFRKPYVIDQKIAYKNKPFHAILEPEKLKFADFCIRLFYEEINRKYKKDSKWENHNAHGYL